MILQSFFLLTCCAILPTLFTIKGLELEAMAVRTDISFLLEGRPQARSCVLSPRRRPSHLIDASHLTLGANGPWLSTRRIATLAGTF